MWDYMCTYNLFSEAVPPDMYRKKPMCMSQYDMFQKCRIPRPEMDESRQTPIDQARHVLVLRNGHVSVCVCVMGWILSSSRSLPLYKAWSGLDKPQISKSALVT